jgi:hypothetical protein
MQATFKKIEKKLEEVLKARESKKLQIQTLEKQKETYNEDYIDKKLKDINSNNKALIYSGHEEMIDLLQNLAKELQDLIDQPIDLEDQKLTNALRVIDLAGNKLDYSRAKQINESFRGNPAALEILSSVYDKLGVPDHGGLNELLLPKPKLVLDSLVENSRNVYHNEGSINRMAQAVGKVAALVGAEFNNSVDPGGFDAAMRAGAGLPQE